MSEMNLDRLQEVAEDTENIDRLRELADRLTNTEYELSQANALLAAIVQGAEEAILTKDFYGQITSWNPAAQRVYGYAPEEAIGKHISLIVPDDKRVELEKIMIAVRNGESTKIETERVRKNGQRVHVKLTISPVRSAKGEIIGASSIAHPGNWEWDEIEAAKESE